MIKNKTYKVFEHAFLSLAVIAIVFTVIEPAVSYGAGTVASTFTISQQVNAEVSFATAPSNVTMSPALGGITGGQADGSTQFVVTTNDLNGYNMTVQGSSSGAMIGQASSTNSIPAYGPVVTPDFNFTVAANAARFGFSVGASSTSDVAPYFRNNNTVCNTGNLANTTGTTTAGLHCWWTATSTALTVINRNTITPSSGATSTLYFRVVINSNPSPVIPNDTYLATTTLTVNAN